MTTLIFPGVGGSEPPHWQSWLETQLGDAKRIEQGEVPFTRLCSH
jgi:predicted alpha/beta hydrolase family esterase